MQTGHYRKEGNLLVAHKMQLTVMGQDIVLSFDKVTFDVDLPKDRFDPPAEIKALIDKPADKPADKPVDKE